MKQRYLFIDRDGTLIEEPLDEQIDSFAKLKFVPTVFKNLGFIQRHLDFKLVMVTGRCITSSLTRLPAKASRSMTC